jgi:hypothetical protein
LPVTRTAENAAALPTATCTGGHAADAHQVHLSPTGLATSDGRPFAFWGDWFGTQCACIEPKPMWTATKLAAGACFLLAMVLLRRADACSCRTSMNLLSASPSRPQGATEPLVFVGYSPNLLPTLRDRTGTPHALELSLWLSSLGGCGIGFQLLVPSPALIPGKEYTLAQESGESATWIAENTVRFRAMEDRGSLTPVRLELESTVVSHEAYVSGTFSCHPPELDDRLVTRTVSVSLDANPSLLLFLRATLLDPIAGPLVATSVTLKGLGSAEALVSIPIPQEALSCLDVAVLDATGVERWRSELCPTDQKPVTVSAEAMALPTPAPERPSSALPTDHPVAAEVGTCSHSGPPGRRAGTSSLAGLAVVALLAACRGARASLYRSPTGGSPSRLAPAPAHTPVDCRRRTIF